MARHYLPLQTSKFLRTISKTSHRNHTLERYDRRPSIEKLNLDRRKDHVDDLFNFDWWTKAAAPSSHLGAFDRMVTGDETCASSATQKHQSGQWKTKILSRLKKARMSGSRINNDACWFLQSHDKLLVCKLCLWFSLNSGFNDLMIWWDWVTIFFLLVEVLPGNYPTLACKRDRSPVLRSN